MTAKYVSLGYVTVTADGKMEKAWTEQDSLTTKNSSPSP
jgi:hypothetical protein